MMKSGALSFPTKNIEYAKPSPHINESRMIINQPIMRKITTSSVVLVVLIASCPSADASIDRVLLKALARFFWKGTGGEVSEQFIKKVTRQVGEEMLDRTTRKLVGEGGEKSLVKVGEMVAKHGPNVVFALDNVPNALPVFKLLNQLPDELVGKAASRLAAGTSGKKLAAISEDIGVVALRAEVKHPGVGIRFADKLGREGAELSLDLTTNQAFHIGRHVDDIAALPPEQKSELLKLISKNADRFARFVGRFVENNSGKVLFTAASTPIILANSESIFGNGEIAFDDNGNPLFGSDGNPTRVHRGILPEILRKIVDVAITPVRWTLCVVCTFFALTFLLIGASKVWKCLQKDKLEPEIAKRAAEIPSSANR